MSSTLFQREKFRLPPNPVLPPRCSHAIVALGTAILLLPVALTAQTVRGRVIGAQSRAPLEGATVTQLGAVRGVTSDIFGGFVLHLDPELELGLAVELFGYVTLDFMLPDGFEEERIRVELPPDALRLEGLTVEVDRLAVIDKRLARRRMSDVVTVFDQAELDEAGAITPVRLIRRAMMSLHRCRKDIFQYCVQARRMGGGSPERRVKVCIDETPALDGVAELFGYSLGELYLIEVYGFYGHEVRVYTTQFILRALTSGAQLHHRGTLC